MNKEHFIQLIDKYQAGSATEAERVLVEEYLKKMETKGQVELSLEEEQRLQKNMWHQIQERTTRTSAKVVKISWFRSNIVRMMAAVAAACVIFLILMWKPWENASENANFQTVAVALGEPIQKVVLTDGTLIWVKPNSSLTYPKVFQGSQREVNLKGEALFEVAKDAAHPFLVHSGNLNVKVLGTSFNVKDASEKDIVEVAVLTGRVLVNPTHHRSVTDTVVLQPFQKLVLSKKDNKIQKTEFSSTASYIAGTEYSMSFNNVPLDSIIRRIEAKFNVTITTDAPKSRPCRVSGDFTDLSLTHTLDFLCKTLEASYTQKQNEIRITGVKCK